MGTNLFVACRQGLPLLSYQGATLGDTESLQVAGGDAFLEEIGISIPRRLYQSIILNMWIGFGFAGFLGLLAELITSIVGFLDGQWIMALNPFLVLEFVLGLVGMRRLVETLSDWSVLQVWKVKISIPHVPPVKVSCMPARPSEQTL